jgi:AraC-like DNA-binding protein
VAVEDSAREDFEARPRRAWRNRSTLLAPDGRPELAARFVRLVQAHAREVLGLADAARGLHVSVSVLKRSITKSFDFPPAILLGLARCVSLGGDIAATTATLQDIAARHTFSSASNMGRFFVRYSGETPGDYRLRSRLLSCLGLGPD